MAALVRIIGLLVFLLSFLLPSDAPAREDFPLIHRDLAALSGKKTWGVFIDSHNTLWIGTDIGLYKYDGCSITHFNINDGLEDNEILNFWGEEHNRLWLYTFTNRLCFIDLHTDRIYNSSQLPLLKTRSDFTIKKVNFYGNNLFVLNERNNISRIDLQRYQVRSLPDFPIPKYLFDDSAHHRLLLLGEDTRKKENGIYELGAQGWQLRRRIPMGTYYYDRSLYVLKKDTLYRYAHDSLSVCRILPPFNDDAPENKLYVFSDSLVFVVRKNAFLTLIGQTWQIHPYTGLSDVLQDKEGNLWMATRNDGLLFVPFFYTQIGQVRAIGDESFSSMHVSGNRIMLHSDKGSNYTCDSALQLLHRKKMTRKERVHQMMRGDRLYWLFYKKHLSNKYLDLGINIVNDRSVSLADTVIHATIKEVSAYGDTMYIRAARSLYKMYFDGQHLRIRDILQLRCMSLYTAPDGKLWYATLSKLCYYRDNRSTPIVLPNNYVVKIINGIGPYILLSNGDNKIYCYDTVQHSYLQQKISDDPNIYLEHIFDIDAHHKFLKANEQLYLLSYDSGQSYKLTAIEHLEIDVHDIADIQCAGGYAYILTPKACYRYPFNLLTRRKDPPDPEITRIGYNEKNGQQQLIYPISPLTEISLPSDIRNLSLPVAAHTITGKNTQIQYALTDEEQQALNWQYLKSGSINISLPKYGKTYVYLRASSTSSGLGSAKRYVLSIAYPLWYDYRVIGTGILLLLICSIYGALLIFRRFIRKKEQKQRQEIQQLHNEFRAMNAMMNPHFVFNSLNSIQSFINDGNKQAANQYLQIFSKLIRRNMTNINASHIPLRWELDVVSNYLEIEKLRFSGQLSFELMVDERETLSCRIPPLLIQPLVENAILHGLLPKGQEAGAISIRISHLDDMIEIVVSDNGIGYYNATVKNHDQPSLGIDYIRKRLDKIAGMTGTACRFELIATPGQPGTTIVLCLPDDL